MSTTPPAPPPPEPSDAWLDDLLRQSAPPTRSSPPEDHAQFTDRVLASLPPPASEARRVVRLRRGLLLGAATALGCGVAWLCGGSSMGESLREVANLVRQVAALVDLPATAAFYAIVGVSALAMLSLVSRRDLRRLF